MRLGRRKLTVVTGQWGTAQGWRWRVFPRISHEPRGYGHQWCGLRPSVLGQDRSETKNKSVLVLVLQVWCCVVKHGLVTLVVKMILKDAATFQVLLTVSLFWSWSRPWS